MKKQVGKSKVFTKESLTAIQDKMRNACIKSYNKFYGVDSRLKAKQKGRNQDINVKEMENYREIKKRLEQQKQKLENANKQINNALANKEAQGIAPIEEIFASKTGENKCFIGINGSFTTNKSPRTNVVISEGNVAKNLGNAKEIIGIDYYGYLKKYDNVSAYSLLNVGVKNTFRVSGAISEDNSTDVALRTLLPPPKRQYATRTATIKPIIHGVDSEL